MTATDTAALKAELEDVLADQLAPAELDHLASGQLAYNCATALLPLVSRLIEAAEKRQLVTSVLAVEAHREDVDSNHWRAGVDAALKSLRALAVSTQY